MTITITIDDTQVPALEAYRLTQCTASIGADGKGIITYHYTDVPDMITKITQGMVTNINADAARAQ